MSERDVAYERTGFLLNSLKEEPDFFTPYTPPLERDSFESFPDLYQKIIPYEWTGDIESIRDITKILGEPLAEDRANPERIWVDAGIASQLKTCGYTTVYYAQCPIGRDDKLHRFERTIQENRRKMLDIVGTTLSAIATVASFVPVLGQAVSVILTAAAAVAMRKPIGSALIDTVISVIPGGAAVKDAVAPAVAFGKSVVSGSSAEQAFIDSARAFAVEIGGESAGAAFDLLLALSRGDDLQGAGFALLNKWLVGNDTGTKAARFSLHMLEAASQGKSIERVLLNEARVQLGALPAAQAAQSEIDRAVRSLLEAPRLYLGSIESFAARTGIAREAARAAFMSVTPREDGSLVENASFRMSFVDPSAPLLGESVMKTRTLAWAARRRDIRNLAFTAARPLSYAESLAAIPTTPQAFFQPSGKTLIVESALPSLEPEGFERLVYAPEVTYDLRAMQRSAWVSHYLSLAAREGKG